MCLLKLYAFGFRLCTSQEKQAVVFNNEYLLSRTSPGIGISNQMLTLPTSLYKNVKVIGQ
jgi:hypothetical protein